MFSANDGYCLLVLVSFSVHDTVLVPCHERIAHKV